MTEFSKGIYVQIKFNSFYHRDIKLRANGPNNYQHCWPDKVGTCCVRVGSCLQTDAKTPNRDITLRANGPNNSQHCWPDNVGTWCVCLCEVVERLTVFKLCATTPNNTPIRATQGVETDTKCNIQQCWQLLDRRVTPPKRVTSPTWGPPPPCKTRFKVVFSLFFARNTGIPVVYVPQSITDNCVKVSRESFGCSSQLSCVFLLLCQVRHPV